MARQLQHQSHFTWQSRNAPRSVGDELPSSNWRERALKHRELCPVRPVRCEGKLSKPLRQLEKQLEKDCEQSELSELHQEVLLEASEVPAPPALEANDLEDGDPLGVLSRVEISRYISRWSATHSSDSLHSSILEAVSFEREHLRRGFSNHWPDALWSPGCLSVEALEVFESRLTERIEMGSKGVQPIQVLLRHLLCDALIALGDFKRAAKALAGAVATPSGADALRPPLLIGWEDSLDCNYLKAQHCFRLGRVALAAAAETVAAAQAATEAPQQRREAWSFF